MKVRVVSIGKDKSGLFLPAVEEYAQRLGHYCHFSLLELAPSQKTGAEARLEEANKLLEKKQPRDWLVALDERGQAFTSVEFSHFLGKAQSSSADLYLVVGGDEGLSEKVTQAAKLTLSLSKMTLPHRMARLLLVEQLYRGFTILKREPYHK